MHKAGYIFLQNFKWSDFWIKDGEIYSMRVNILKSHTAKRVEILGISEITRNTRLVQLEIRYRLDGTVNSLRVSGSESYLLTLEDAMGYGRFGT